MQCTPKRWLLAAEGYMRLSLDARLPPKLRRRCGELAWACLEHV